MEEGSYYAFVFSCHRKLTVSSSIYLCLENYISGRNGFFVIVEEYWKTMKSMFLLEIVFVNGVSSINMICYFAQG